MSLAKPKTTVVGLLRIVLALVTLVTVAVGLVACGDRGVPRLPARQASHGATDIAGCASDSLRPVIAAPAQGRWVSEPSGSGANVTVLIGAAPLADSVWRITRPIESIEANGGGDTLRARVASVSVNLERLPSRSAVAFGGATGKSVVDSQAVAVYVVSPYIRLAAHESCAASDRAPRVRYVRRDSAGRVVTDVMLRRASN